MTLYGTNEHRNEQLLDRAAGGDLESGVYTPAGKPGGRSSHTSLIHDIVRALLELRGG